MTVVRGPQLSLLESKTSRPTRPTRPTRPAGKKSAPPPAVSVKRLRASKPAAAPIVAGPIVKSAGGKTRLLPILRAHLPRAFDRYVEPFCGGAALFFDLARPGSIIGDANADLIATYSALAFDVETVIRNLAGHARRHTADPKRHYYFMRDLWNDPGCEMGACERAAVYLYLHRVCFNGLHRVNKAGKFNVPIGSYKNPTICDPDRLRAAAALLSTAGVVSGHFTTTMAMAARGDLIYSDSPYDGAGSFTAYTPGGFDLDEHELLAVTAAAAVDRGVHVMLSNADTPLVRELYRDPRWHLHEISAPRSIAASGTRRNRARELLITSYPIAHTQGAGN